MEVKEDEGGSVVRVVVSKLLSPCRTDREYAYAYSNFMLLLTLLPLQ